MPQIMEGFGGGFMTPGPSTDLKYQLDETLGFQRENRDLFLKLFGVTQDKKGDVTSPGIFGDIQNIFGNTASATSPGGPIFGDGGVTEAISGGAPSQPGGPDTPSMGGGGLSQPGSPDEQPPQSPSGFVPGLGGLAGAQHAALGTAAQTQLGLAQQFGESQRNRITRDFDASASSAMANLEARGLGSSNLAPATQSGVEEARQQSLLGLEDALLGQQLGIVQGITGAEQDLYSGERQIQSEEKMNVIDSIFGLTSGLI